MGFGAFRIGSVRSLILVCVALIVVAGVVALAVWMSEVRNPSQEYLAESQKEFINLTGLGRPVTNKMDERYADADGDLLADPPTDAAKQADPPVIYFSYVYTVAGEQGDFKDAFKDFMAYVSKQTGKPVEYVQFESTEAQAKALRDGKLHVAGFNTGGVPFAVNTAGFLPVSLLAGNDDKGFYKMQVIVPADSAVKQLRDLKGSTLTLTEASSNSGYKAALVTLKDDFNMLPERDYKLDYSGGQEASIEGIASKKYAAAAVASDVLRRAIGAGTIKETDFRVVHESSNFPSASIGYSSTLKPELAAKLRDCLTKFDWNGTSVGTYFANAGQTHFAPADYKKDWEMVRKIDNEIGYLHKIPE